MTAPDPSGPAAPAPPPTSSGESHSATPAAAVAVAEGWDTHLHVFDGRPLPGAHYQAAAATVPMLLQTAAAEGIGRLVLVQPSVLGTDNGLLLQALAEGRGRHRGVVVPAADESDEALLLMHSLGVRGVRINQVSRPDSAAAALALVQALAPRLRALNWHLQVYTTPARWVGLADLARRLRLTLVLDHLGGARTAEDLPADGLAALADAGAWVKLSGWYRLGAVEPYAALLPVIERLYQGLDGRCVWGSDWPHTWFAEPDHAGPPPRYAELLAPLVQALGPAAARQVLCDAPARLYR